MAQPATDSENPVGGHLTCSCELCSRLYATIVFAISFANEVAWGTHST
jgi:hypothetical protein